MTIEARLTAQPQPHKLYLVRVEGQWAIGRFVTLPGDSGHSFKPNTGKRIFPVSALGAIYEFQIVGPQDDVPVSRVLPFLRRAA